ncbi:MAG: phage replisome organizer N-terminal domain-containing protein [Lentihominibacter sp.]
MSIQWIKISTNIFDNRKIKQIEHLPDSDSILVIWFKLLCLAGNLNESGLLLITKDLPYTEEMLANEFNRPINTIRMALSVFEKFRMIEIVDDIMSVSNWEKYQSEDKLAEIREKNRQRQAKFKAKKKALALTEEDNVTVTLPITLGNAVEEDKEIEIDIDIDKEREVIDYQKIINMYNETCVSFPRLRTISDSRKKAIKARLHSGYTYEDFETLFLKAESSNFLKGKNERNWSATFDWLIQDRNMTKVLEGNYDNKGKVATTGNTRNRALQILEEMEGN